MSKKPRNMLSAAMDIPAEVMAEARRKVQMEQAEFLAREEMGVGAETEIEDDIYEKPKKKVKRGPLLKNEEQKHIFLNLAEHSDRIIIDGMTYMHSRSYTVPKSTYDTLVEIMSRGWAHQSEIDGKPRDFYRKQQDIHLRDPGNQGLNV